MKPDDTRGLPFFKMTLHGIANILVKVRDSVRLGDNGRSDRFGDVAAFRRIFDNKYDFVHVEHYTRIIRSEKDVPSSNTEYWRLAPFFPIMPFVGEKSYFIDLRDPWNCRVRVSIKTEQGKVVDLVIQLEIWVSGNWHAVARYDCAHGKVHVDVMKKDGSKEKNFLMAGDLKDVVKRAIDDFKVNWKNYLERCGYVQEETE